MQNFNQKLVTRIIIIVIVLFTSFGAAIGVHQDAVRATTPTQITSAQNIAALQNGMFVTFSGFELIDTGYYSTEDTEVFGVEVLSDLSQYFYLVDFGEDTFMLALLDPDPDNTAAAKLQENYFARVEKSSGPALECINTLVAASVEEDGDEEMARQVLTADYVLRVVTDDMDHWKTKQIVAWCISGVALVMSLCYLVYYLRRK